MRSIGRKVRTSPPPKQKVYCKECKWFRQQDTLCGCPTMSIVRDTPIEPVTTYAECNDLNRHNDCSLHEPRGKK